MAQTNTLRSQQKRNTNLKDFLKERIGWLNSLNLTEARYLPKEYNSPVSTNICGDEVVFILWKKNPLVIQIVNEELAEPYRKYFEVLWGIAEKCV